MGRLRQEHACSDQAGGAGPARRACRARRATPGRLLSPGARGAARVRTLGARCDGAAAAARRVIAGRPTLVRAAAGALRLKHDARRGGRRRQLDAVDACGPALQP